MGELKEYYNSKYSPYQIDTMKVMKLWKFGGLEWNPTKQANEFELRVDEINKANQMNANGKDE